MATNRPDVLDPALLRPGRLDRKVEIALPNEQGRLEILKIHSTKIATKGDIGKCVSACEILLTCSFDSRLHTDFEGVVKLSDGFNGADLRNVCTEAGMFAIRARRAYCTEEDFMKVLWQNISYSTKQHCPPPLPALIPFFACPYLPSCPSSGCSQGGGHEASGERRQDVAFVLCVCLLFLPERNF